MDTVKQCGFVSFLERMCPLIKLESSRLIWISICIIFLCPAAVAVVALSYEGAIPKITEVEFLDVAGELLLLVLVQFWIITIAYAGLQFRTYIYLMCGFGIIAMANTADLLDEFIFDHIGTLKFIENTAYPLGMMLATVGLFKLSRDYRELIQKVHKDRDNWRNKANHDQLTGLLNRRYFFEMMPEIMDVAWGRENEPAPALLMLDIDLFKSVNDKFGHDVGDLLLGSVGEGISQFCRHDDAGFRLGGEEFGVLLTGADEERVLEAAQRLRQRLNSIHIRTEQGILVSRTVSIGVSYLNTSDSLDSWMKRADSALYQAKEQGRNQVVIA
ncbi:GGDEF domain-containing protein [Neptuniibacter sp. SY11_33]|uniref:GGDEF domain-containing protein n=1 Tax=Neptuniibacter sp. SY11_33 TaxID=3398215 RepID=UPI0039F581B1